MEALWILLAALLYSGLAQLALFHLGRRSGVPGWFLPWDDAYIFIRYARQTVSGHPFEWSTGEPSTGASSVLQTAALMPIHALPGGLEAWSRWSHWTGVLALAGLGFAVAWALRRLRLADPWPLAGALTIVWSGPVGLGALAGMESALNSMLIVLACACWRDGQKRWTGPLLASLLCLGRPEGVALTLVAAVSILVAPAGRTRWWATLCLAPAAAYALLNWWWTGSAEPSGAIAKSLMGSPFLGPGALLRKYFAGVETLASTYFGLGGRLFYPPAGWLTAATALVVLAAACRRRLRRDLLLDGTAGAAHGQSSWDAALPFALAWLSLVAVAPLSALLTWQEMRHHHAGLVLGWVLAFVGAAALLDQVRRRWRVSAAVGRWLRLAPMAIPILLASQLTTWSAIYARSAEDLYKTHRRALAWLQAHGGSLTLLVSDAGLPSLVHTGPLVDMVGLGTPELTRAYRHGAGALIESLARHRPLPELAAIRLDMIDAPALLATLEVPGDARDIVIGRVDTAQLVRTPLTGAGIDFAYLPDERRAHLRWIMPPGGPQASIAIVWPESDGSRTLQGCRPVWGAVGFVPPEGTRGLAVSLFMLPLAEGSLSIRTGDARRPEGSHLAKRDLQSSQFGMLVSRWPEANAQDESDQLVWLERGGPGVPCIESVRFVTASDTDPLP